MLFMLVSLCCRADQTALIAPLNQSNGSTIWPASASKRHYRVTAAAHSFLLQTHVRKSAEWWNGAGYWSPWSPTLTSAALIGQKGRVGLRVHSLFQWRSGVLCSTVTGVVPRSSVGTGYQCRPTNWLPVLWKGVVFFFLVVCCSQLTHLCWVIAAWMGIFNDWAFL